MNSLAFPTALPLRRGALSRLPAVMDDGTCAGRAELGIHAGTTQGSTQTIWSKGGRQRIADPITPTPIWRGSPRHLHRGFFLPRAGFAACPKTKKVRKRAPQRKVHAKISNRPQLSPARTRCGSDQERLRARHRRSQKKARVRPMIKWLAAGALHAAGSAPTANAQHNTTPYPEPVSA